MNQTEIAELNAREPSADAVADLTNVEIANLDTEELRKWAVAAEMPEYHLFESVATLPLDNVMINTSGALPALEKFLTVLKMAYVSRTPEVIKKYDNVEVRVFATDDAIRTRLTYHRDQALSKRDG